MRTFHIGGTATVFRNNPRRMPKSDGFAHYIGIQYVRSKAGERIAMNREGKMWWSTKRDVKRTLPRRLRRQIPVEDGAAVKANQILLEWDPYTSPS